MIKNTPLNPQELNQKTTEELKQELLQVTQDKDIQPLKQKVQFYQDCLAPIFTELSQRNPFPQTEEQIPLILGVWKPVWSTIPFQDTLPGRLPWQSYQIFHDDGFYANIARYAPGNKLKLGWLQKIASVLLAFDLMIVQKYQIKEGEWLIENISIKQALRWQGIPLTIEKADSWFTEVVQSYSQQTGETTNTSTQVELKNLDSCTAKKYQTALGATPQFEHLYIDNDFRLVKSRRQAKQRYSYTIAIRTQ
ncbi:hypothetical protein IQ247_06105 [Plectonema cf. radiosum LEGE 06105]|uniref:Uncharacterized protein n=1 Tax=Plectonema cf. radiosum LEGE 06105 TaxID=945769 RepID=A0A8J7F351_9CYAN|nr:hypothetical protein [Plectonema radiosum]MBE9212285.1 hypothetical protein [Plectonema cf. radiosum LEGE 06105]